jgi:hypothetical protein
MSDFSCNVTREFTSVTVRIITYAVGIKENPTIHTKILSPAFCRFPGSPCHPEFQSETSGSRAGLPVRTDCAPAPDRSTKLGTGNASPGFRKLPWKSPPRPARHVYYLTLNGLGAGAYRGSTVPLQAPISGRDKREITQPHCNFTHLAPPSTPTRQVMD